MLNGHEMGSDNNQQLTTNGGLTTCGGRPAEQPKALRATERRWDGIGRAVSPRRRGRGRRAVVRIVQQRRIGRCRIRRESENK